MQKELKTVRLYVVEEQEIYREVYKSIFSSESSINLLNISTAEDCGAPGVLKDTMLALEPDVLLMSTKKFDGVIIEQLKQIRKDFPNIGVIILLMNYATEDLRFLKMMTVRADAGMAIFLKQSIDRVDQLRGMIKAVGEGQVILDPTLTGFLFAEKQTNPILKELTHREFEIMNLLAQGHTNAAIAEALFIDVRTVHHHINSIYSKVKTEGSFDNRHPRVSAARLYLQTTGELAISDLRE